MRLEYYLNQEKKQKMLFHERNQCIFRTGMRSTSRVKQLKTFESLWQDLWQGFRFLSKMQTVLEYRVKIIRKLPFKAATVKKNLDLPKSMQRKDRQMERIRETWQGGTTKS